MNAGYDEGNIFARILAGLIPCTRVYEDAASLAFMDVMPCADGHVLVIPKRASRNLLDAAPETLAALMPVVQKVAQGAKAGMKAEGVSIWQFNEAAGGQSVFHLHFHILPRWEGVALRPPGGPMAKPELLSAHAAQIIAAMKRG